MKATAVPAIEEFSGLCFMGGPMSVNDDLPWLPPTFAQIRQAVALGIPVIGHCLGGQLISKALGGTVTKNPVKELGWGEVATTDPAASDWLGDLTAFRGFSLAWRNLFHSARRDTHPQEPVVRQPGFCPGAASGHAMPCGDDRGDDPALEPAMGGGKRHARRHRCRRRSRCTSDWTSASRRCAKRPTGSMRAGSLA